MPPADHHPLQNTTTATGTTYIQNDIAEQAVLAHGVERGEKRGPQRIVRVLKHAIVLQGVICKCNESNWINIYSVNRWAVYSFLRFI